MSPTAQTIRISGVVIGAILFAAGCDTAVNPVDDRFDNAIAIHGFLDSSSDTQFVRVAALAPSAIEGIVDAENLRVSSREAVSGRLVEWRDSMVTTEGGLAAHLFHAVFRPAPGDSWHLTARRGELVGAEARTDLPAKPVVLVGAAIGDSLNFTLPIELDGVIRTPFDITLLYDLVSPADGEAIRIELPYGAVGVRRPNSWRIEIYLRRDRDDIGRMLGLGQTGGSPALVRIGARVELYSDEWSSSSPDPGLITGHGFFGSMGRYEVAWRMEPTDVQRAGYVDAQPPQ